MRSIASSTNEPISHDGAIAATWCRKFWRIARAGFGVDHLGMERARRRCGAAASPIAATAAAFGVRVHAKSRRRRRDRVAVRHPNPRARRNAEQNRRVRDVDREHGRPELAVGERYQRSAKFLRQQLHAVADAEQRNAAGEHFGGAVRRIRTERAFRAAAQDDRRRFALGDLAPRRVVG